MTVTVFSKAGCSKCAFTKRALENDGISYTESRVDLDPKAMDYVIERGVGSLPYVEVAKDGVVVSSWIGLNMTKIKGLSA